MHRQGDRHDRRAIRIPALVQLFDIAFARFDVQRILRGGNAGDHALAGRHHDLGLGQIEAADRRMQHLRARRALVREQIQPVVEIRDARDLGFGAEQFLPARLGLVDGLDRRHIHGDFALHAVGDDAQRPMAVMGDAHERNLGRRHLHARRMQAEHRMRGGRAAQRHAEHFRALILLDHRHARLEHLQTVQIEGLAIGCPRRRAELRAVDRLAHGFAGLHIDDVHNGVFRPRCRNAVSHIASIGRRVEEVDRMRLAGRFAHHFRVEQQLFGPVQALARKQLELIVIDAALFIEPPIAGGPCHARNPRRHRFVVFEDVLVHRLAPRDRLERRPGMIALRLHPGRDLRVLDVLHVSIRVIDLGAEEGFADIAHRCDGQGLRAGGGCDQQTRRSGEVRMGHGVSRGLGKSGRLASACRRRQTRCDETRPMPTKPVRVVHNPPP